MQAYKKRLQSAGARYSLICAGFGVLIAALMTTVVFGLLGSGLQEIVVLPYFRAPLAVGAVTLSVATYFFGRLAGALVFRFGIRSVATPIIGILLALGCLGLVVASAFATHYVSSIHQPEMLDDYVIGPALTIIGIGFAPAVILGLVFSWMIRSEREASQ